MVCHVTWSNSGDHSVFGIEQVDRVHQKCHTHRYTCAYLPPQSSRPSLYTYSRALLLCTYVYVEPQLKLASVVCCMYTGWFTLRLLQLLNTVCCVMSQLLHVSLPARGSTLAWAMLGVWMELKFHSQSSKSTLRCRCVHGEALITSKTLQWHPPPHRLPLPQ